MTDAALDALVDAVLYEGHILYPYRASSRKNRQRFTFGRVYPAAFSAAQGGAEPCTMQTQCLADFPEGRGRIRIEVRFLQPIVREVGRLDGAVQAWPPSGPEPTYTVVESCEIGGTLYQSWHESAERRVAVEATLPAGPAAEHGFSFPASRTVEALRGTEGRIEGVLVRRTEEIRGRVTLEIVGCGGNTFRVTARVANESLPEPRVDRDDAVLGWTMTSTHTILRAEGGSFCSLADPPENRRELVAGCRNVGSWPVLAGDEAAGERDVMLSSPIILPDYPQLAPESPGALYDGTEIDEILTLRILTMTDGEKREMRQLDDRSRRILERTEALSRDELYALHGTIRPPAPTSWDEPIFGEDRPRRSEVRVNDVLLRMGDRVRLRPRARADIMDLALAGRVALIEAIEEDAEGRIHVAVVMEDDPGVDLGWARQPGHRFFYGPDELEPCAERVESP